ncbi:MAG: hypothetical protein GXO25_05140 [Euryarchaeota archaeon]|nr:hypothetical protein [Euryarchaeota archaeon]
MCLAVEIAMDNFVAHAPDIIAREALAFWNTAVNTVKTAVNAVKKAVDAFVNWIKREVSGIFEGLKKKINDMEKQAAEVYKEFIEAVYNKNTVAEAISVAKILVLAGAAAVAIAGLTFALGMAINANPIVGAIIAGVVTAAFMAVFYELYPKQYLEAGEQVKSVEDIMLMPADELYDTDKKYGDAPGWVLTAIPATIGSSWSGVASNEAGAVGLSLALTMR